MKLGVFTPLFGALGFEAMLEKVTGYGLDCIELGTGNYPGSDHLDLDGLLETPERRNEYLGKIQAAGLSISALSCHGNPVHPNRETAARTRRDTESDGAFPGASSGRQRKQARKPSRSASAARS